jgi:hypothetical protein
VTSVTVNAQMMPPSPNQRLPRITIGMNRTPCVTDITVAGSARGGLKRRRQEAGARCAAAAKRRSRWRCRGRQDEREHDGIEGARRGHGGIRAEHRHERVQQEQPDAPEGITAAAGPHPHACRGSRDDPGVWAQVIAIIVASFSILANFAWLPYYPVWALLVIGFDLFVIWAVTVHGNDFRTA